MRRRRRAPVRAPSLARVATTTCVLAAVVAVAAHRDDPPSLRGAMRAPARSHPTRMAPARSPPARSPPVRSPPVRHLARPRVLAPVPTRAAVTRLAGEIELDEILFAALALLALYCFVALRRSRRTRGTTAAAARVDGAESTKKARGATRAQIECKLAHTTVTLYEGGASAARAVPFDQEQCAICLDFLRRPPELCNSVRILRCAHAFHAGTFARPQRSRFALHN